MSAQHLQIGEVAERAGLSLRTVRYYEEMGLIVPADRTEGGFRLYTEAHVLRLQVIKRMKPLGFTVQEIGDLLAAQDTLADPDAGDAERAGAHERLREFSSAGTQRVDELRRQLVQAEAFADDLRRQSQSQSRRRGESPSAKR